MCAVCMHWHSMRIRFGNFTWIRGNPLIHYGVTIEYSGFDDIIGKNIWLWGRWETRGWASSIWLIGFIVRWCRYVYNKDTRAEFHLNASLNWRMPARISLKLIGGDLVFLHIVVKRCCDIDVIGICAIVHCTSNSCHTKIDSISTFEFESSMNVENVCDLKWT